MTRLRTLFLCGRKYHRTKLNQERFQAMEALSRVATVACSGPGFPGFDSSRPVHENILRMYAGGYPDLVVVYKPLEMGSFAEVRCSVAIIYNELAPDAWREAEDTQLVLDELRHSRASLVLFHFLNDLEPWRRKLLELVGPRLRFANLPICADPEIFRPLGLPKKWDLLLIGDLSHPRYALRRRLREILGRMSSRWRCHVWPHPGYELEDAYTFRHLAEFAGAINSARICLACSGTPRSRFPKYVEVPMCGTALAADLPGEDHGFFLQFLIQLDMSMTDEEIILTLEHYLEREDEREGLARRGLELSRHLTWENYASRFLEIAREHLSLREEALL